MSTDQSHFLPQGDHVSGAKEDQKFYKASWNTESQNGNVRKMIDEIMYIECLSDFHSEKFLDTKMYKYF